MASQTLKPLIVLCAIHYSRTSFNTTKASCDRSDETITSMRTVREQKDA